LPTGAPFDPVPLKCLRIRRRNGLSRNPGLASATPMQYLLQLWTGRTPSRRSALPAAPTASAALLASPLEPEMLPLEDRASVPCLVSSRIRPVRMECSSPFMANASSKSKVRRSESNRFTSVRRR
jgi:hypothetical protein